MKHVRLLTCQGVRTRARQHGESPMMAIIIRNKSECKTETSDALGIDPTRCKKDIKFDGFHDG